MSYSVYWVPKAEEDLVAIWTSADDSSKIAQSDPLIVGESRDRHERILFVFPLGIRYAVNYGYPRC